MWVLNMVSLASAAGSCSDMEQCPDMSPLIRSQGDARMGFSGAVSCDSQQCELTAAKGLTQGMSDL